MLIDAATINRFTHENINIPNALNTEANRYLNQVARVFNQFHVDLGRVTGYTRSVVRTGMYAPLVKVLAAGEDPFAGQLLGEYRDRVYSLNTEHGVLHDFGLCKRADIAAKQNCINFLFLGSE